MFTGIIAERGTVVSLTLDEQNDTAVLVFRAPQTGADLPLGGSIAVNGVCLSATSIDGAEIAVDVIGETLVRTTTGSLKPGMAVNLERCVPAGGRLDGHVVQGHVDGVGSILEREDLGKWERVRIGLPTGLARYAAEKGSVAIDGVSLTVTAVSPAGEPEPWLEVGLIPMTLADTGLGEKQPGDPVNLEMDVLAKYAERLLSFTSAPSVAAETEVKA
jgi:riboflavin synthase